MDCLACGTPGTRVKDSQDDGTGIRRKRTCACGAIFFSTETPDRKTLRVATNGKGLSPLATNGQQAPPIATHSLPLAPVSTGGVGVGLSSGLSGSDPGSLSASSSPPDQTPGRVSDLVVPRHEIPRPFRPPLRMARVGAITPAYLAVYDAYPKKIGKTEAAQLFQEIADDHPGGEAALSAAILAVFTGGMLKRHPYSGDDEHRPSLEKFLAGRRWEDSLSAPDGSASPAIDPYCEFHRQPKSRGRRANRPSPTCPECQHVAVRSRPPTSNEPTTAADLIAKGAR